MASPAEKTFPSQRLTLSYAEWGAGDAPLVVLVHGGRDQKRSWDWVARALAGRYRVIAHDLRGHGSSEWVSDGEYGVMDHVFDLASLMDHLEAYDVTLIGHSLGGNIAVRYAGLFPERIKSLVAIEGLGPSPKMLAERAAEKPEARLRDWIEQRRKLSKRTARKMAGFDEALGRMRGAHGHLSDDYLHHLTQTGIRENEDGTVSWRYDPAALGRSPSDITNDEFRALWTQITCPSWLVYGEKSWASNPAHDGRAALFPNAHVTEVESAGHWLHHDQFDAFMNGLDAFLASVG